MLPQKQTIETDFVTGVQGNCMATCVACLLDMPISKVPNFIQYKPNTFNYLGQFDNNTELDNFWAITNESSGITSDISNTNPFPCNFIHETYTMFNDTHTMFNDTHTMFYDTHTRIEDSYTMFNDTHTMFSK